MISGMLPRRSNIWTRTLGTSALVLAATAPLLLWVRHGAPPRHDVLGVAVAALVCALAWTVAGLLAPAVTARPARPDRVVPGVPVLLPPVRLNPKALTRTLTAALLFTAAGMLLLGPPAAASQRIGELRKAGAEVLQARIESASNVTVTSWTYRKERPGSSRKVRDRPAGYAADLVLSLERPGRSPVRITVPHAPTDGRPEPGRTVQVLAAPGHPELGGYLEAGKDLRTYLPGFGASAAAVGTLGAFLLVTLAIALPVGRALHVPSPKDVRALRRTSAKDGRLAVRVAVRDDEGDLLGFTPLDGGGEPIKLAVGRCEQPAAVAAELAGQPGWLITRKEPRLGSAVFLADDGTYLWGELRTHVTAGTPARVVPARDLHRTTRLTAAHPAVHLGPLVLASAALALVAPTLLGTLTGGTGFRVTGALLLAVGAIALAELVTRRRRNGASAGT